MNVIKNNKEGYSKPNNKPGPNCGPRNQNHKTYRVNEILINKAICKKISERRIDVKAREICADTGLTAPTFYYHCRGSYDALIGYENKIEQGLKEKISGKLSKRDFYLILVSYIRLHHVYFLAAANGGSHFLLKEIISSYREILVAHDTNDRNFNAYIGTIIALINYWLKFEKRDAETAQTYGKRLASIQPMHWW